MTVLSADQITKWLAIENFGDHPKALFGGALRFVLTSNSGAAFSMGEGLTILLTSISLMVAVLISTFLRRVTHHWWIFAVGLAFGGILGNLTDRIARDPGLFRGRVIDWIAVPHWPVFNLADASITCAALLMTGLMARNITPTK